MPSCRCLLCITDPWKVSRPRPRSLSKLAEAGLLSFLISQSSHRECEVVMIRSVNTISSWLRSWLPGGPLSRDIRQSLMKLVTTWCPPVTPGAREVVRTILCDQVLTSVQLDGGGGHFPRPPGQTLLGLQVRKLASVERSVLEELTVTQVDQASFEPLTRLLLHPKVSKNKLF